MTTRVSSRRKKGRWAPWIMALALLAALFGSYAVKASSVVDAFAARFSATEHGNIDLIGNTLMTCSPSATCTDATAGTGATVNNNDFSMIYVDADSNGATNSSSSAALDLPNGSQVLFAGLYWGAESASAARDTIKLKLPGGSYQAVTATKVAVDVNDYAAFADVTPSVAALPNPDGTYWVADIEATTGTNQAAGWSLVVAYEDPASPLRNLTVFDGYLSINTNSPSSITTTVNGFLTPPSGTVTAEVGMVTFEGDLGLVGDQFLLNGSNVSDGANASNNVFNSTIADFGAPVTSKNPDYQNQLGFDIDHIDGTGFIPNNSTSATLTYTTQGDVYYPTVLTFAVDVFEPRLDVLKDVDDVNGARLVPGDQLEFTIRVDSTGSDAATDVVLVDPIPAGTTYVPDSITILNGPNAGVVTDASGDDVGEFDAGNDQIKVRLGAGATSSMGGTIDPGDTAEVTFRVTLDDDVTAGSTIENQATVNYSGETVGGSYNADSDSDANTPGHQPAEIDTDNPPAAASDSATTSEDTPVDVDVMANDDDPDGRADLDPASVQVTAGPAHGQAAVDPSTGVIAYTPDPDYSGTDSFRYQVCDQSGMCDTTDVGVTINPANDPPNAIDDSASVPQNTPVQVDVLANDTDPDGWIDLDPTTVQVTAGPGHGQVSVDPATGVVAYTPDNGLSGSDSFTYQVCDYAGACDSAQVVIGVDVVDMPPDAVDDSASSAAETPVDVDVLANDTDPDGWADLDPASVEVTVDPDHGQVSVDHATGVVTYTPDTGYSGAASFTYRVCDMSAMCDTAVVTVSVATPADPPAAINDSATTDSDVPVEIDVLANDIAGLNALDPTTVTVVSGPSHGQVQVDPDTGVITYDPNPGYDGPDSFTYQVCDTDGQCAIATVAVNVALPDTAVADLPGRGVGPGWAAIALVALLPFSILLFAMAGGLRRRGRPRQPRFLR